MLSKGEMWPHLQFERMATAAGRRMDCRREEWRLGRSVQLFRQEVFMAWAGQ